MPIKVEKEFEIESPLNHSSHAFMYNKENKANFISSHMPIFLFWHRNHILLFIISACSILFSYFYANLLDYVYLV